MKEKCYCVYRKDAYGKNKLLYVFKKKEDAECFIDTMNSEMTSEERWQGQYLIHETEMITDWRLENR